MASIRKRGSGWQAQIRKKGTPVISKTFNRKADALTWAQTVESEISRRIHLDRSIAEQTSLQDVLRRYCSEILPMLRGAKSEASRIKHLNKYLGSITLSQLHSQELAEYRDSRLEMVGPQSVKHELGLLNRILTRAHYEWGIILPHGIPSVAKPKLPQGRIRRFEGNEENRLLKSLNQTPVVQGMIRFALATAMRRGEIIQMKWMHINVKKNLLEIPLTKTNIPRTIPLTTHSRNILSTTLSQNDDFIFQIKPDSVTQAFTRACKRAKISNFHFHDLRHEATSRLFEKGLSVMEVAAVTGHKDLKMLQRYTHLRPEDILKKME